MLGRVFENEQTQSVELLSPLKGDKRLHKVPEYLFSARCGEKHL